MGMLMKAGNGRVMGAALEVVLGLGRCEPSVCSKAGVGAVLRGCHESNALGGF
jgi:hypothetical protein